MKTWASAPAFLSLGRRPQPPTHAAPRSLPYPAPSPCGLWRLLLPSPTLESGCDDSEPLTRLRPGDTANPSASSTWSCEWRPQPTPQKFTAPAARSSCPSFPFPSSTGSGSTHALPRLARGGRQPPAHPVGRHSPGARTRRRLDFLRALALGSFFF